MERFTYMRASSTDHAVALLNEPGVRSRVLAGGTDLLLLARENRHLCDRVVDISLVPELHAIRRDGDTVTIGAAATFSEVMDSPVVRETAPLLAEACRQVGAVQIRNMGTLGGNVANAAACADSLPALVCLDAAATVVASSSDFSYSAGFSATEVVPVAELVVGPNRTRIPPGGLLVALSYRVPEPRSRGVFLKLGRRNAMAISRLTVAALGRLDAEGRIAELRVVPGSATPQIRRFTVMEEQLLGRVPDEALFEEGGRLAVDEMRRITGRRWSSEFKEPALAVMVTRALRQVFTPTLQPVIMNGSASHSPLRQVISEGVGVAGDSWLSWRHAGTVLAKPLRMTVEFILNGQPVSVGAPAGISLLELLRDYLGLTGTKEGCGVGECGACSVVLDGRLVNSCLTLAAQAGGRQVTTIEGVRGPDGGPNDLQQAFIDYGAVQCGFCIPGMVLAGEALLAVNPQPARAEIRAAIAGNLCRCTGYQQIVDAIEATAAMRRRI